MFLLGIFTNASNNIVITLNSNGSYILSGLDGFNTNSGEYSFENSKNSEYPTYLVLNHSIKPEDMLSTAKYKLPIKIINSTSFKVKDNFFCKEDFYGNLEEIVFFN